MTRPRLAASLIFRVLEGRAGRRIVVHDLRTKDVQEFGTWEDAMRYARRVAEIGKGLR